MGQYKSFKECVAKNKKKKDPKAYCGSIYWATEGRGRRKKKTNKKSK